MGGVRDENVERIGMALEEEEKRCLCCEKSRPITDFAQRKGHAAEHKNICQGCELASQQARRQRVARHRARWQQPQEREDCRQQAWERRMAVRQVYEQRQREREDWYLQQPDRYCRTCRQLLSASAFGALSSPNGLVLQANCMRCHEMIYEQRQLACCLCRQRVARRDFLSSYDGYALCGDGSWISLCCKRCEASFYALPVSRQEAYIRVACERSFPSGQVIYAEVDPVTAEIRYVGRTGKPKRRHAQHLSDASPRRAWWGVERKAWHTRSNWMHALAEQGLAPAMQILQHIDVSPLVVEWELRYIWHGIQRGWKLLNGEAMDETLVARVTAASFDFLRAPFELLVQQHFFAAHGLIAFLHQWYCSNSLANYTPGEHVSLLKRG